MRATSRVARVAGRGVGSLQTFKNSIRTSLIFWRSCCTNGRRRG